MGNPTKIFPAQQVKACLLERSSVLIQGRDVAFLFLMNSKAIFQRAAKHRETVVHINHHAYSLGCQHFSNVTGTGNVILSGMAVSKRIDSKNKVERIF